MSRKITKVDLSADDIKKMLRVYSDKKYALSLQRFFKTGAGEYGEGDLFIGVRMPDIRKVARMYVETSYAQIKILLKSSFHEDRICALIILVYKYAKASFSEQERIYKFYISNTKHINNWDLVDVSAHKIVGAHLYGLSKTQARKVLKKLTLSENLWERRIAIIATLFFINKSNFEETFIIAKALLKDEHDLIHKAVGWMIREVGNRNREAEEEFLQKYYEQMPRTMLRYAIEKFPENLRQKYLKGKI